MKAMEEGGRSMNILVVIDCSRQSVTTRDLGDLLGDRFLDMSFDPYCNLVG
jgi:hypothetical protein